MRELLLKKTVSGLGKRKGFYLSDAKCNEQVCMVSKTTIQRILMIKPALISISVPATIAFAGYRFVWTSTDYPYVGFETVYFGQSGAMEIMVGFEV